MKRINKDWAKTNEFSIELEVYCMKHLTNNINVNSIPKFKDYFSDSEYY